MTAETNKQMVRQFMERAFNQGDLAAVDTWLSADAVDHQELPGTNFSNHLKQVITALRTAFPDLHFELHDVLAEGEMVAFRSTMTGTHLGPLQIGPGPSIAPTGRHVSVPHMHFVQVIDSKGGDLWHLWDTPAMLRQLGIAPQPQQAA
jgi:predicted ester cyclase